MWTDPSGQIMGSSLALEARKPKPFWLMASPALARSGLRCPLASTLPITVAFAVPCRLPAPGVHLPWTGRHPPPGRAGTACCPSSPAGCPCCCRAGNRGDRWEAGAQQVAHPGDQLGAACAVVHGTHHACDVAPRCTPPESRILQGSPAGHEGWHRVHGRFVRGGQPNVADVDVGLGLCRQNTVSVYAVSGRQQQRGNDRSSCQACRWQHSVQTQCKACIIVIMCSAP